MDRREALKKLAAGGAVAAGGSMVLSSNRVAYAASVGGVTGIPAPGEPLPITYNTTTGPAMVQIQDATTPGCADDSPVTTTHSWKINSYAVAGFASWVQMLLWDASNTSQIIAGPTASPTCGPACTGYSAPTTFSGITLKKRYLGSFFGFPIEIVISLQDGDYYEVDTMITWTCAGHPPVTAEYRFSGTYPNAPTVTAL